jgi:hypothetical protein
LGPAALGPAAAAALFHAQRRGDGACVGLAFPPRGTPRPRRRRTWARAEDARSAPPAPNTLPRGAPNPTTASRAVAAAAGLGGGGAATARAPPRAAASSRAASSATEEALRRGVRCRRRRWHGSGASPRPGCCCL